MESKPMTVFKSFGLSLVALALGACAAKQEKSPQHFGTEVNFPTFQGPGDFFKSLSRVNGILLFKRLDGERVDTSWITPAFREKLCLVVTINNHCGGG